MYCLYHLISAGITSGYIPSSTRAKQQQSCLCMVLFIIVIAAGSMCDAGYKERVSKPVMTEAARLVKYAIAAYGAAGYQSLHHDS